MSIGLTAKIITSQPFRLSNLRILSASFLWVRLESFSVFCLFVEAVGLSVVFGWT
jgi:hypothetical protein